MTAMFLDLNYAAIFATSRRAAWEIEDVIGPDDRLDFRRPFLPEEIALVGAVDGLSGEEQLLLNHIRSHEYLSMFGLVEEFIVPFVLDHVRPGLECKNNRMLALLQFAEEEVKHIALFKRFHRAFTDGFGHRCGVIGPARAIGKHVLSHDPLAVALFVLMIEWTTQSHYLGSVRNAREIDPLFAKLLRSHWIEEAQHARLDTLLVRELGAGRSQEFDRRRDRRFPRHLRLHRRRAAQPGRPQSPCLRACRRTPPAGGKPRPAARQPPPDPARDLSAVRTAP